MIYDTIGVINHSIIDTIVGLILYYWFITPIFDTYNYHIHGVSKPTNKTGWGPLFLKLQI